jgi:hypothetical protein
MCASTEMEAFVQHKINRRQAIVGVAAVTASTTSSLTAQTGSSRAEAEYRSARQLVAALADRKVSSAELVDRAIARIEAHDGKLMPSSCVGDATPIRQELRSRGIPFVIYSGYPKPAGTDEIFIEKPAYPDTLMAALEELLSDGTAEGMLGRAAAIGVNES